MIRIVLALLLCLLLAPLAAAQEWALKMFNTASHDFGTVAKGSKCEYRFQIKNIYEEDAKIISVSSSCGCTTPRISKRELKTFETAEIVAEFNTRDFHGHKSATLTVMMECVSHAEVQLRVTGFIRTDVVTQPGSIDFGTVDQGASSEQKLHVLYAGRDDWKILDAKTADPWYEVEMKETGRGGGRVSYDLLVRLTKDAPIGYVKDQLLLVTNDAQAREFPIDMQGRISTDITISPQKLFIGVVKPGQTVTKNLVVRGKKPFKIVDVKCPDKSFQINASKDAKSVHLVPVIFTAGDETGRVSQKISIRTDHGDVVQAFTAFAEVVKPDAAKPDREKAGTSTPETSNVKANDGEPAPLEKPAAAEPLVEPKPSKKPSADKEPLEKLETEKSDGEPKSDEPKSAGGSTKAAATSGARSSFQAKWTSKARPSTKPAGESSSQQVAAEVPAANPSAAATTAASKVGKRAMVFRPVESAPAPPAPAGR